MVKARFDDVPRIWLCTIAISCIPFLFPFTCTLICFLFKGHPHKSKEVKVAAASREPSTRRRKVGF